MNENLKGRLKKELKNLSGMYAVFICTKRKIRRMVSTAEPSFARARETARHELLGETRAKARAVITNGVVFVEVARPH